MSQIFDFLFSQYTEYATTDIVLEIVAVVFGFLSVWFSKQNNILVFPTGMISTIIFVYLLLKWELLGDMMINAYYFAMSVYGWFIWTRKVDESHVTPISKTTSISFKFSSIKSLVFFICPGYQLICVIDIFISSLLLPFNKQYYLSLYRILF